MTEAAIALKNCPFCGGTDIAVVPAEDEPDYDSDYPIVAACMDCSANGPFGEFKSGADAIAAWNARAASTAGEGKEEEGWLAELRSGVLDKDGPSWWQIDPTEEDGGGWTKDASRALRFARKIDAENYIYDMGWTEVVATDHIWSMGRSKPATPVPVEAEGGGRLEAWDTLQNAATLLELHNLPAVAAAVRRTAALIESQGKRIEELREALEPFAKAASHYDTFPWPETGYIGVYLNFHSPEITVGDLRRARSLCES